MDFASLENQAFSTKPPVQFSARAQRFCEPVRNVPIRSYIIAADIVTILHSMGCNMQMTIFKVSAIFFGFVKK